MPSHNSYGETRPKSPLGKAVGYMRNNWQALKRFLSDGRLPIDNNDAERNLRRIALRRKNWMFMGSREGGDRTAVLLTVIANAHRHHLDVWAYLQDTLKRLAEGETDLEALLPDVELKPPRFRAESPRPLCCQKRQLRSRRQR